jgi:hypothetical protein
MSLDNESHLDSQLVQLVNVRTVHLQVHCDVQMLLLGTSASPMESWCDQDNLMEGRISAW